MVLECNGRFTSHHILELELQLATLSALCPRIVNSELHHCEGALSSLDNISAFGSSLFDVWTSAVDSHN